MENFEQGLSRFKVHNYQNSNEPVVLFDQNETTRFDGRTDEEFVNTSSIKTNLPIEELITNPEPKRKRQKGKIPRPLNMWIIYRKDKNASPEFKGLKASVVTEKICTMWDIEPKEVKEFYAALSRMAAKNHIERYGKNYKYRPGPYKRSKNKQNKQKERRERRERTERTPPPSSEESSPNISELMDTIFQFFPTPPSESISPISSDVTSESQLPTPEYSPIFSLSGLEDSSKLVELLQAFPPLTTISQKSNQELLSEQHLTPASELEKLLSTACTEQDLFASLECAQPNLDNAIRCDLSINDLSTNDNLNYWLSSLNQMEEIPDPTKNFNGQSSNEHLLDQFYQNYMCDQLYTSNVNNINFQNDNNINGLLFTNQINSINDQVDTDQINAINDQVVPDKINIIDDQILLDYLQHNLVDSHLNRMDFDNVMTQSDWQLFDENSDMDDFDFTRQPSQ